MDQTDYWDALLAERGSLTFRMSRGLVTAGVVATSLAVLAMGLVVLSAFSRPESFDSDDRWAIGVMTAFCVLAWALILSLRLRPRDLTVTPTGIQLAHRGSARWTEVEDVTFEGTARHPAVRIRLVAGKSPRTLRVTRNVRVDHQALADWLSTLRRRALGPGASAAGLATAESGQDWMAQLLRDGEVYLPIARRKLVFLAVLGLIFAAVSISAMAYGTEWYIGVPVLLLALYLLSWVVSKLRPGAGVTVTRAGVRLPGPVEVSWLDVGGFAEHRPSGPACEVVLLLTPQGAQRLHALGRPYQRTLRQARDRARRENAVIFPAPLQARGEDLLAWLPGLHEAAWEAARRAGAQTPGPVPPQQ